MLQKMRKNIFWLYDLLKGQKINEHFKDVKNINSKTDKNRERIKEYLSQLLTHALETTEFYSRRDIELDLKKFPVINKNIIRENFHQFLSKNYEKKELKKAVTSGSTGTPLKVLYDYSKVRRNTADTLYFAQLASYELGQRLYYCKVWNDENKKRKISLLLQNIVPIDVQDQSDVFFKEFIQQINHDKSVKSLLGYASFFEALCKYLDKTKYDEVSSNVGSIIAMSEALNSYTKNSMEKYFDCEVVSRYSNIENGILAQQEKGKGDNFLLNKASYVFEILGMDNEREVPEGKPGRIVVTDLFNYGMPVIRYDTGDVGIWKFNEEDEKVLAKVEGRRMDMIYNTNGELVSSFVITNNMWKYSNIKQYQFIQEASDSYCFKLNSKNGFNKEKELINEFRSYFGNKAKIKIKYVDEIPLLSSGKRKKVVNEMN